MRAPSEALCPAPTASTSRWFVRTSRTSAAGGGMTAVGFRSRLASAGVCLAAWPTSRRSWPPSSRATRTPPPSCSRSSTTSCGSSPPRGWPRRSRARPSRPPPWSTRRTSGWSAVTPARHWNGRGHFFAAAAEAMRRILVETARRKRAVKRGGGPAGPNSATRSTRPPTRPPDELLALDEALDRAGRGRPARRPSWSSSGTSPACPSTRRPRPWASPARTADRLLGLRPGLALPPHLPGELRPSRTDFLQFR